MNEKRENKERQDGYVFLLRTSALHPSNNLGCKWENLSQGVSSGRIGPKAKCKGRKHLTNLGILKSLYCLPVTISVPETCWALWVSLMNFEDP